MTTWCLFLLSCVLFASVTGEKFSHDLVYKRLVTAYVASCPAQDIRNWTCYWCVWPNVTRLTVTHIFSGEMFLGDAQIYGYGGYTDQYAVFAFRGTRSWENWVQDFAFFQTVPFHGSIPGAEVHWGFMEGYRSLRDQVRQAAAFYRKRLPKKPFLVLGHSLGGAIATLAAADLRVENSTNPIELWTFGSPRLGNTRFAEFVDRSTTGSWRIVNRRDPVPHLPMNFLGFEHVNTEYWMQNSTSWKICDKMEDAECSDSLWSYDVGDHVFYLDIPEWLARPFGCY